MPRYLSFLPMALMTIMLGACTDDSVPAGSAGPGDLSVNSAQPPEADNMAQANPFFTASPLPLKFPPFDQVQDSHFLPAFSRGMAEQLEE
ncbi:MAG: hypothetical protein WD601_08860, partial [Pseudohongiellaceae bacterium]